MKIEYETIKVNDNILIKYQMNHIDRYQTRLIATVSELFTDRELRKEQLIYTFELESVKRNFERDIVQYF